MHTSDRAQQAAPRRRPPRTTVWFPGRLARALVRHPLETITSLAQQGSIVELRLPFKRIYLLNEPAHVQQVLVTDAARFTRGLAIERSTVILGRGLLTSDGEEHRRQRRLLQPAFHRHVLSSHVTGMAEAAERRAAHWHEDQAVDVSREMLSLTLASVVSTLFGDDTERWGDEVGHALGVLFDTSQRLLLPMGPALMRLPLPAHRRFWEARKTITAAVDHLLDRSRRHGRGLLGPLLAGGRGQQPGLSDVEARDQVMTMLLAGHETTACALTWTWHLLAGNPDVEARLHEEIDRVLAGRRPTPDDLANLTYAERVFAESMRLYPPVWSIGRRSREAVTIDGHEIPAGALVMLNPWIMHRDPRFWCDPERCDPDRFLRGGAGAAGRPREAYFPFGDGRRRCIGEQFAWLLGVTALATIGRRVRFLAEPDREISPLTYLFLLYPGVRPRGSRARPTRGLPMRVALR